MSAKSQGRAAAASGKSKSENPHRNVGLGAVFMGSRPGDSEPNSQRKFDEWEEGYADKKREMERGT